MRGIISRRNSVSVYMHAYGGTFSMLVLSVPVLLSARMHNDESKLRNSFFSYCSGLLLLKLLFLGFFGTCILI